MRIMVFEFDLYFCSASDITKKVNEFCDEYNVIDVKVTKAKSNVDANTNDSLFYTIIYRKD